MIQESCECPVCGTPAYRRIKANIGDFIRHELSISNDEQAWSWLCDACEQIFSTPFLDADQLGKYYQGYLSEDYCRRRVAIEPWFASYIPHLTGADGTYDKIRFEFYDRIIDFNHGLRAVVDFGGGDGHFARAIFGNAKVDVLDIDGGRDDKDLLSEADCIFAAHVFEHIPKPRDLLRSLTSKIRAGCLVYIEVPLDMQGNPRSAFSVAEAHELMTGEPDGSAITLLHEHLTHYSKKSLGRLLCESGVKPLEFYVSSFCIAVLGRMEAYGPRALTQ